MRKRSLRSCQQIATGSLHGARSPWAGMRPVHVALAVLVAAVWGLNFVVIEVGLEDFPPLLLSALRYLLASLPLLADRRAGRRAVEVGAGGRRRDRRREVLAAVRRDGRRHARRPGLARAPGPGVLHRRLRGGAAAASGRELAVAAGLALATAGLALVASGLDGVATPAGFALVIGAAAAWGIGNVAIKRAAPPDPLRFMTWICVVPPLPLLALSLAFEGPREIGDALAGIDLGGIAAVAYIAFAATTFGWGLWAYLLRALLGRDGRPVLAPGARSSGSASRRCCSTSRSAYARSSRPRSSCLGRPADAAGAADFTADCGNPGADGLARRSERRIASPPDAKVETQRARPPR